MAAEELIVDEDGYASSEDSDFRPDDVNAATAEPDDSGSDDESKQQAVPGKRKNDDATADGDTGNFDNSGDEALIEKANKRQKKRKKGKEDEGPEESGEGGLVKTRSMRAAEKAEKKQAAAFGPVTIDVDALWAEMKTGKITTSHNDIAAKTLEQPAAAAAADSTPKTGAGEPLDMIRIKRKYNFAGKVHTEEKLVPRSSAEAKLYLESIAPTDDATSSRAAPRKAFRSAFEPVLEPFGRRGDLNLGVMARLEAREESAKKLNTVEKSRMDWAGFVDREGIKEELEMAGRAKGSFVEREGFLARSEARREEDARKARVSAMG